MYQYEVLIQMKEIDEEREETSAYLVLQPYLLDTTRRWIPFHMEQQKMRHQDLLHPNLQQEQLTDWFLLVFRSKS